jgi:hypothetical protein
MNGQVLIMYDAGTFGLRQQTEESPRRAAGFAQRTTSDGVAWKMAA